MVGLPFRKIARLRNGTCERHAQKKTRHRVILRLPCYRAARCVGSYGKVESVVERPSGICVGLYLIEDKSAIISVGDRMFSNLGNHACTDHMGIVVYIESTLRTQADISCNALRRQRPLLLQCYKAGWEPIGGRV